MAESLRSRACDTKWCDRFPAIDAAHSCSIYLSQHVSANGEPSKRVREQDASLMSGHCNAVARRVCAPRLKPSAAASRRALTECDRSPKGDNWLALGVA